MDLTIPPDEIGARVRAHLARSGGKIVGSVLGRTVLLTVGEADTHFWSPHLDVQLEDDGDGGTRLAAMFAPHPHVWTAFVGVQLAFGFLSMGAAVWVTSMWMLGRDLVPGLVVLGLMLFGGGFAYGAAYVGQGIGSEQMYELRAFLVEAVRDDEPPSCATVSAEAARTTA